MMIQEGEQIVDEWMLFTFAANSLTGDLSEETTEGLLEWHPVEDLAFLPMAEGDRTNLQFAANQQGIQYGTFYYTPEFQLIKEIIQSSIEEVNHQNG